MTVKNRNDVHTAIQEMLSAEVVTRQGIATSVEIGRIADDLNGQGPILAVLSGGSFRRPARGDTYDFYVELQIWTPYLSSAGQTTYQAEVRAGDLEHAVATVVDQRKANETHWRDLRYTERSAPVDYVTNEGHLYIFETIILGVKGGS